MNKTYPSKLLKNWFFKSFIRFDRADVPPDISPTYGIMITLSGMAKGVDKIGPY